MFSPRHLHFKAVPYLLHLSSHLVRVQNLQKCFVDIWLALKAVFDLVDIVDGVIELHRLVVLQRRSAGRCAAHRRVRLDRGGAGRGVGWDGRIVLAGWGQSRRLHGLQGT